MVSFPSTFHETKKVLKLNKKEKAALLHGMSNHNIQKIMDKFEGLSDIKFRGVFANDAMPLKPEPGVYILNLENIGEDGSHWVLLWIREQGKNLYYDSYGIVPTRRISKLVKSYNEQPFQGVQMQSCAYFAMYIAQNIMNGLKPTGDLIPFDADHNENVLKNYFF